MTIEGVLKDFYAKMGRMNAGCLVIFAQSDLLNPTKANIGIGTNAPPAAANSILQQLLRPTDATFKILGGILLGDKPIAELNEQQVKELGDSAAAIMGMLIPTLTLAGLRQEDQKLVTSASSLISLP